jgi:hypothetical protein
MANVDAIKPPASRSPRPTGRPPGRRQPPPPGITAKPDERTRAVDIRNDPNRDPAMGDVDWDID